MGDVADCAAIELNIQNITGVSDADDDFIRSAQKFVVSSVPSDLLIWAITETVPGTHGGNNSNQQITLPVKSDSLVHVRRDQFEASKVDGSMRGFIGNSNSLYLATNTFPKYYIADGNRVIVKPDPDDTYTAHAQYVDYAKINDDSDLRSAVIYRASASEFTKLATGKVTDWTDLVAPVSPTTPDFGSDLSITAVSPVAPSLTSVTFTSIDSALDTVAPLFTTATVSASSVYTGSAPTYTAPVLSLTAFPTITWSFPSVPVAPSSPSFTTPGIGTVTVGSTTLSNVGTPPVYTSPTVTGGAGLTGMEAGAIADSTDQIEFDTWWDTLGDMIETEEDSELAASQIQKINAYIQAFQAESQDAVNIFNDANVEYQAKLQEGIQQAQINAQKAQAQAQVDSTEAQQEASLLLQKENQEYVASIQNYSATVQTYQDEVNKVVSGNQAEISEWQIRSATDIQKYGSDMQNALNNFNKENTAYQSAIQESMQEIQVANQVNMAQAQSDLQAATSNKDRDLQRQLQNGTNDMQAIINDNNRKVTLYQAESAQYQANVSKEVQDFSNTLQKETQEYQSKVALYNSDLQNYQAEIGEKTAKVGSATQNAAYYSKEADKYYQWANAEVQMYIQNNSKMINQTIAAQSAQQQRR